MSNSLRNRIKAQRRIRAGDLVPHEFNFRAHGDVQRNALQALHRDMGFARSLLAYELPDGRLKVIDGHLRRDLDPDQEVEVEVLDVTEEEARGLLSIDPLAELAGVQEQLSDRLLEVAPRVPPELEAAWQAASGALLAEEPDKARCGGKALEAQFYVLITCRNEKQQVELLARFLGQGLQCRAVLG